MTVIDDLEIEDNKENLSPNANFLDDLSFLEQCGDADEEAAKRAEELARKSLYVRFDPLVALETPEKPFATPSIDHASVSAVRTASKGTSGSGSIGSNDLFARDSPNTSNTNASLVARLQAVKESVNRSVNHDPMSPAETTISDPFSPPQTPQVGLKQGKKKK